MVLDSTESSIHGRESSKAGPTGAEGLIELSSAGRAGLVYVGPHREAEDAPGSAGARLAEIISVDGGNMNITRRDVVRRLAGLATAASIWASGLFVLDDDTGSVVAGRQAQRPNRRTTSPSGSASTTQTTAGGNAASSTTAPVDGSTTTAPATTAPATTALPDTTLTTSAPDNQTTTTHPPQAAKKGSFTIMLRGLEPTRFWWNAPYARQLNYTPNVGWVDGDRIGYRGAWMFLEHNGRLVGRVTFARVPGAKYALINDKYMKEGVRTFDGSLAPAGTKQTAHVSFIDGIVDQEYEPYMGPDERPTIRYLAGGDVLEVRDYKKTNAGQGLKFRQVSATSERVAVVAYEHDLPVIVIYYDSIDGSVKLESDL